jgi:NAD(P)-dependent dehydrogenase (short-subunit alcohol dehydrogenase family)
MASVLITGCSTGIGRATALRLVRRGRTVYATARRVETLADLEAAGCRTLALDVTDEASMQAAVDAVQGGVGVLINNAGYSQSGALETLPMESVRRQFETNVFGLLRMCQLVLPAMRAAGEGKIVNVSSMGGRLTFPGGGAYHATKYAVEAISDALRMEVGRFGIDVICVEPGLIRTEFGETAAGSVSDGGPYSDFNAAVARSTRDVYSGPMSRLGGDADDVAEAIERALAKRRAPTRVPVTPSARLLMGLRRVLPDRAWDRVAGSAFR